MSDGRTEKQNGPNLSGRLTASEAIASVLNNLTRYGTIAYCFRQLYLIASVLAGKATFCGHRHQDTRGDSCA